MIEARALAHELARGATTRLAAESLATEGGIRLDAQRHVRRQEDAERIDDAREVAHGIDRNEEVAVRHRAERIDGCHLRAQRLDQGVSPGEERLGK